MTESTSSQEASTSSTKLDNQSSSPIRFARSPSSRGLTRIGGAAQPELTVEDAISLADKTKPASLSSSSGSPSPSPSLFCRRCSSNQQIQLSLLADFDHPTPAGTSKSKGRRPLALSAFRADLDERYPVLCKSCRPGVEKEIEQRNRLAQRDIWRARMERDPPSRRISGAQGVASPSRSPSVKVKPTHYESSQEPIPRIIPRKENPAVALVRAGIWAGTSVVGIAQAAQGLSVLMGIQSVALFDDADGLLAATNTLRPSLAILDVLMLGLDICKMASLAAVASSDGDKDEILDADWEHPEEEAEEQLNAIAMRKDLALYVRGSISSALLLFLSAAMPSYDNCSSYSASWVWCQSFIADIPWRNHLLWSMLLGLVVIQCGYTLAVIKRCLLPTGSDSEDDSAPVRSTPNNRMTTTSSSTSGDSDAYAAFVPGVSEALASSWASSEPQHNTHSSPVREATPTPTPMDWQPTPSVEDGAMNQDPDDTMSPRPCLAPQRFYPPEPPTGLEGIFDRGLTLREDGEEKEGAQRGKGNVRLPRGRGQGENKMCFCIGLLNGLFLAAALVAVIWVGDLPSSAGDAMRMVWTKNYKALLGR